MAIFKAGWMKVSPGTFCGNYSSIGSLLNAEYKQFLWGAATSAFQVEGSLENDMTEWERQGRFSGNGKDLSYAEAAGHWQKWQEDFALLKTLDLNAYRFSMDWGRVEPQPGQFDEHALDQYSRMVDRLLELGIEPMLTLHHFTHPKWFHEKSPWHREESVERFAVFSRKISKGFSDRISLFITFNEPLVWLLAAYGEGKFPPGEKDLQLLVDALQNILKAHVIAYDILKTANPQAQVGIAKNLIVFNPQRSWHLLDRGLTFKIHNFYNTMLLNAFERNRLYFKFPFLLNIDFRMPLSDKLDFWGINYYYRLHIRFRPHLAAPFSMSFLPRSGEGVSDLGWEIYAKGLWQVMSWIRKTGKPFYITENGIADKQDSHRAAFLKAHLKYVKKALEKNLPLRGYFHWSLLDNYEWLEGKSACFGLYRVDYENGLHRSIRKSGEYFRDYIAANSSE